MSDPGSQMLMQINLDNNSCVSFGYDLVLDGLDSIRTDFYRWEGFYNGPGNFQFAVPGSENVVAYTDHSAIIFKTDGTPCESILMDGPAIDAEFSEADNKLFVAVGDIIQCFT